MGLLNIKSLSKEGIKKKIEKTIKPIIMNHTQNPCKICGGKR